MSGRRVQTEPVGSSLLSQSEDRRWSKRCERGRELYEMHPPAPFLAEHADVIATELRQRDFVPKGRGCPAVPQQSQVKWRWAPANAGHGLAGGTAAVVADGRRWHGMSAPCW